VKSQNIDKSMNKTTKKGQKTQNIQNIQDIQNIQEESISPKIEEHSKDDNEQAIALSGLTLMLERLVAYFQQRAASDDRETLVFCLHHLFHHVDELYCETLPALATITHTRTASLASSPSSLKTRIGFRYALWTRLQEMQQHIERVESLCHLLNRTVPRLLCILDMPGEPQNNRHSSNGSMSPEDDTERWQHAYELLTRRLNTWQERNGERLSFASDTTQHPDKTSNSGLSVTTSEVSNLSSSAIQPVLSKIDGALMLVFDSAGAIFGDIVPDFQIVARGDDEVVATLLFDLMQQGDLLLIQCDALFGPIQDLIRHYMLFE